MFSEFDIQKIQNLEPGWEEAWGKIYISLLYESDGGDGPLYKFAKRHFGVSETKESIHVDEFVTFMEDVFLRKIEKQSLFDKYNPEEGSVLGFLCSRIFLEYHAKQFKKHKFATLTMVFSEDSNFDEDADASVFMDPKALTPQANVYRQKITNLFDAFQDNIVVHFRKSQITREYTYAGVQLYPRLSQEDSDTKNLYEHVNTKVSNVHPAEDPDRLLQDCHQQDSAIILQELDKYTKKINETNYHKGSKSYLDDCGQYFLNFKKLYLYPLKIESVVFLLKTNNRNVVDKWHGEYLDALPVILQNYKEIYDKIQNEDC